MTTGTTSISLRAIRRHRRARGPRCSSRRARWPTGAWRCSSATTPTRPRRCAMPSNDSRDLGAALRELGFKTIVKENTSRAEMIAALQEFGKALDGAEAALFFYAGHAMQFKDRNYLIPIDAVMGSEDDVTFFSVEVSQVFDRMERARTRFNFVILDACRDNPFRDTFKVSATGLAQMSGPSGTLIAYATAPGATAADGFGRNGIYTGPHPAEHQGPRHAGGSPLPQGARGRGARHASACRRPGSFRRSRATSSSTRRARPAAGAGQAGGGPVGRRRGADRAAVLEERPGLEPRRRHPGLPRQVSQRRLRGAGAQSHRCADRPQPCRCGAACPRGACRLLRGSRDRAPAPRTCGGSGRRCRARRCPPSAGRAEAGGAAAGRAAGGRGDGCRPRTPPSTACRRRRRLPAAAPAAEAQGRPARAARSRPGIRELDFADGSVYVGAMRGVQLHGKGQYTSKAFKYEGEFKDGLKHGTGSVRMGQRRPLRRRVRRGPPERQGQVPVRERRLLRGRGEGRRDRGPGHLRHEGGRPHRGVLRRRAGQRDRHLPLRERRPLRGRDGGRQAAGQGALLREERRSHRGAVRRTAGPRARAPTTSPTATATRATSRTGR